ncbi:MAG: hypothetical protein ACRDHX_16120 [Chloroflexota bacterium]
MKSAELELDLTSDELHLVQFIANHPWLTVGQLTTCLGLKRNWIERRTRDFRDRGLIVAHLFTRPRAPGHPEHRLTAGPKAWSVVSIYNETVHRKYQAYLGISGPPLSSRAGRSWQHTMAIVNCMYSFFKQAPSVDAHVDWLPDLLTEVHLDIHGRQTVVTPDSFLWLTKAGKSARWLVEYTRTKRSTPLVRQLATLMDMLAIWPTTEGLLLIVGSEAAEADVEAAVAEAALGRPSLPLVLLAREGDIVGGRAFNPVWRKFSEDGVCNPLEFVREHRSERNHAAWCTDAFPGNGSIPAHVRPASEAALSRAPLGVEDGAAEQQLRHTALRPAVDPDDIPNAVKTTGVGGGNVAGAQVHGPAADALTRPVPDATRAAHDSTPGMHSPVVEDIDTVIRPLEPPIPVAPGSMPRVAVSASQFVDPPIQPIDVPIPGEFVSWFRGMRVIDAPIGRIPLPGGMERLRQATASVMTKLAELLDREAWENAAHEMTVTPVEILSLDLDSLRDSRALYVPEADFESPVGLAVRDVILCDILCHSFAQFPWPVRADVAAHLPPSVDRVIIEGPTVLDVQAGAGPPRLSAEPGRGSALLQRWRRWTGHP